MIVLAPDDRDPRIQEFALRPFIITTVNRRNKIKEVPHTKKHATYVEGSWNSG